MKRSRRVVAAAAALAVAGTLPGCVVAVGSTTKSGSKDRMDRLEERLQVAEQRLGITPPEVAR